MFELDPASEADLDAFCTTLSDAQAQRFRKIVDRIRADPSGKRQPTHRYTRPFRTAAKYANIPSGVKVWELKTNHVRALFITGEVEKDGVTHRRLFFLKVKGRRFMRPEQCPWPH